MRATGELPEAGAGKQSLLVSQRGLYANFGPNTNTPIILPFM